MDEEKPTFTERSKAKELENTGKALDNEAIRLKRGYLRGTLLPVTTHVVAWIICFIAFRYFCIKGTLLDKRDRTNDQDAFYDAQRDYYDGNLDAAVSNLAKTLGKEPKHGPANQLLARIEITRGNRKSAIACLRSSLETSINRKETAEWISELEASQPK